jgi:hypothetical protein
MDTLLRRNMVLLTDLQERPLSLAFGPFWAVSVNGSGTQLAILGLSGPLASARRPFSLEEEQVSH